MVFSESERRGSLGWRCYLPGLWRYDAVSVWRLVAGGSLAGFEEMDIALDKEHFAGMAARSQGAPTQRCQTFKLKLPGVYLSPIDKWTYIVHNGH